MQSTTLEKQDITENNHKNQQSTNTCNTFKKRDGKILIILLKWKTALQLIPDLEILFIGMEILQSI